MTIYDLSLSCSGVMKHQKHVKFCFFSKLKKFNIKYWFIFLAPSSLFFPQEPSYIYFRSLDIVSQVTNTVFSLLLFSFCFPSNYYWPDLSDLLIFSFVMFNTSAKPFQRFHILYFSVLKLKFLSWNFPCPSYLYSSLYYISHS